MAFPGENMVQGGNGGAVHYKATLALGCMIWSLRYPKAAGQN